MWLSLLTSSHELLCCITGKPSAISFLWVLIFSLFWNRKLNKSNDELVVLSGKHWRDLFIDYICRPKPEVRNVALIILSNSCDGKMRKPFLQKSSQESRKAKRRACSTLHPRNVSVESSWIRKSPEAGIIVYHSQPSSWRNSQSLR